MSKPEFINMTSTEWWVLKEIMENQRDECVIHSYGFCEAETTKVKTPSGDCYTIEGWDGMLESVTKTDPNDWI
jgi:hypothetical protein